MSAFFITDAMRERLRQRAQQRAGIANRDDDTAMPLKSGKVSFMGRGWREFMQRWRKRRRRAFTKQGKRLARASRDELRPRPKFTLMRQQRPGDMPAPVAPVAAPISSLVTDPTSDIGEEG